MEISVLIGFEIFFGWDFWIIVVLLFLILLVVVFNEDVDWLVIGSGWVNEGFNIIVIF